MDKTLVAHPQVLGWLRESILDSHIDTFLAYLRDRGYAKRTQHSYSCAVGHFAHWLSLEKARLTQLDEQAVTRFLSVLRPHCSCPYPVLRTKHEIHAALRHLLTALRTSGVIPQRQDSDPITLELARFDNYMLRVRGLAASTRRPMWCSFLLLNASPICSQIRRTYRKSRLPVGLACVPTQTKYSHESQA